MATPRRPLRLALLFNLTFLASAAVLVVGLTTLLLRLGDLRTTYWTLAGLWLATTTVFVVFGLHLVDRLVLRPLQRLGDLVDALAAGEAVESLPDFESEEFAHLGDRFLRMTEQVADAQTQVVRVEKLAGLGRLAAGVAHEVRNPLGAIGNYVEVLRKRGEAPEIAGAIGTEVGRIDGIIESLLAYSRPGPVTGTADLNSVVEATLEFLRMQGALKGLTVETALARELPPVRADHRALQQVVVNLLLNARDAVPHGRVEIGTVAKTFRARREERREDDPAGDGSVGTRRSQPRPWRTDLRPDAPGVVLYVADDGPGVPDADRERVFDPFFSTKDPGEGVGLGLAMVARTVDEAGGVVWVDRSREGGAVFKVFLPQVGAADAFVDR